MVNKKNLSLYLFFFTVINFTLIIQVRAEGDSELSSNNVAQASGNVEVNKFDIYEYRIQGNSVLSQEQIENTVYAFLGQDRVLDDVDRAREALEKEYQDQGYKSVQVLIPQQSVKDGVVFLQVIERRVGKLSVQGEKYSSTEKIKQQAASFTEGQVPNFNQVNKDLIALNKNPDRRVSPAISEGQQANTIDVDLVVDDDLPLHGSLELNNRRSFGTTEFRTSANISYSDLWQRGHVASLSYQFAPKNLDDSQVIYASYLAPIENTRYSVMANVIRSDSNVSTLGGIETLGKGNILGIRGIANLRSKENFSDNLSFGIDRKDFKQNIGFAGKAGAEDQKTPLLYYPISLNYTALWRATQNTTQADLGFVFASRQLGDDIKEFQNSRMDASGQNLALRFGLSNIYDFKNGMQLLSNLKGQITDQPLISYEQFSIGGADSVRGYYEAEVVGDYGVSAGVDLKSPALFRSFLKNTFVDDLNLYGFLNAGSVHTKRALKGVDRSTTISSTGLGLSFRVFDYVDGNVEWALPLQDGLNTREGDDRVLFQIKSSF